MENQEASSYEGNLSDTMKAYLDEIIREQKRTSFPFPQVWEEMNSVSENIAEILESPEEPKREDILKVLRGASLMYRTYCNIIKMLIPKGWNYNAASLTYGSPSDHQVVDYQQVQLKLWNFYPQVTFPTNQNTVYALDLLLDQLYYLRSYYHNTPMYGSTLFAFEGFYRKIQNGSLQVFSDDVAMEYPGIHVTSSEKEIGLRKLFSSILKLMSSAPKVETPIIISLAPSIEVDIVMKYGDLEIPISYRIRPVKRVLCIKLKIGDEGDSDSEVETLAKNFVQDHLRSKSINSTFRALYPNAPWPYEMKILYE